MLDDRVIRAVFEGGVLRPESPLDLPERTRVSITLVVAEPPSTPGRTNALREIAAASAVRTSGVDLSRDQAHARR